MSTGELAAACQVDPKTVERWVASGRIPHRKHRALAAAALHTDETVLWPNTSKSTAPPDSPANAEIVASYPNRACVPRGIWLTLLEQAQRSVDILVFSGTFFAQTNPRIARMLAERAKAGTRIRLCFGDPHSEAVALRDREEGLRGTLSAKIRASLTYYQDLPGVDGCEIRLHGSTLYASLFRYDDQVLVNPHIWGQPASANPLVHLRRFDESGWFDLYAASFEAVWSQARPWAPDERNLHG